MASSGPGQPVSHIQPASALRTTQAPRPLAQPPVAPLPAASIREPDIVRRSPHGASEDEQKSAAAVVLPQRESLADRRAGVLHANTPASEERRTEPGLNDEGTPAAESPRRGRLAGSQDRGPAPQPVGGNAAAPPAPVIRVSIGRIVVKAENLPAAKPAPARSAQPALSLDGYLKTRSGGDA
jgi:hypothetical protein